MTKPIAIITGASTGIGKELAVELSNDYFVYLISRNIENLKKTKAIIHNKNNDCEIISADTETCSILPCSKRGIPQHSG